MSTQALPPAVPGPPAADPTRTDTQLLRGFLASRDSGAFEAIVRRHGPMVLGVCLRVLQHRQDAEDAFQAAFIVLAKKAGSIRPPEKLAGWLYGVAHRTALKARGMRKKRQEKEAMWQNPAQDDDGIAQAQWKELAPIVDQELMRLPEHQRLALVLSVFAGHSKSEIASTLGIAEGTISSRLARAREALREGLARRGIALTAAALGTALASNAGAAVSEGLIVHTTQTAAAAAAGAAGVAGVAGTAVPAGVAALSRGVLHAMFISKLKLIAAWVIVVSVIGTGSGLAIYSVVAREGPPARPAKPAAEDQSPIRGNIISLAGDTLTVATVEEGQKVRRTVTLAGEGGISLSPDGKGQEARPGKREQLIPGTSVVIALQPDGRTARTVAVMGRGAGGTIDAIDNDTITILGKGKEGRQKQVYRINDSTMVVLSFGKEKGDIQRGTIADLEPGMSVNLSLSAADKDLARSITVQPPAQNPKLDRPDKGTK